MMFDSMITNLAPIANYFDLFDLLVTIIIAVIVIAIDFTELVMATCFDCCCLLGMDPNFRIDFLCLNYCLQCSFIHADFCEG